VLAGPGQGIHRSAWRAWAPLLPLIVVAVLSGAMVSTSAVSQASASAAAPVGYDLEASGTGVGAVVPLTGPNAPCAVGDSAGTALFVSQVPGIESALATHIGLSFTGPAYIELNTQEVTVHDVDGIADMYTYACAGTSPATGKVTDCAVHIEPHTLSGYPARDTHAMLIHELTHCILMEHFGAQYSDFPKWYAEGLPTWVMAELGGVNVTTQAWWEWYLDTSTTPLFKRSYDAVGFFVHLEETGTNVWHVIVPMGNAFVAHGDSDAAGWAAAAPSEEFLATWASSYVAGRYPGAAWDTLGPGVVHYEGTLLPPTPLLNGDAIPLSSAVATPSLRPVNVGAQVVQLVGVSAGAQGMMSLGDGRSVPLATAVSNVYCTSLICRCPPMSNHPDQVFQHIAPGLEYVGITGGLHPASATLRGETLEAYCGLTCFAGQWVLLGEGGGFASGGAGMTWTATPGGPADGTVVVHYADSAPIVLRGIAFTYRGTSVYEVTLLHVTSATTGSFVADPISIDETATFEVLGKKHTIPITGTEPLPGEYDCPSSESFELKSFIPHGEITYDFKRDGPPPTDATASAAPSAAAAGPAIAAQGARRRAVLLMAD